MRFCDVSCAGRHARDWRISDQFRFGRIRDRSGRRFGCCAGRITRRHEIRRIHAPAAQVDIKGAINDRHGSLRGQSCVSFFNVGIHDRSRKQKINSRVNLCGLTTKFHETAKYVT